MNYVEASHICNNPTSSSLWALGERGSKKDREKRLIWFILFFIFCLFLLLKLSPPKVEGWLYFVLLVECLLHRNIESKHLQRGPTSSRLSTPEINHSERTNGNVISTNGMYTTYYTNGNGSCDNLSLNKYQDQEMANKFYEKNREIFVGKNIFILTNFFFSTNDMCRVLTGIVKKSN